MSRAVVSAPAGTRVGPDGCPGALAAHQAADGGLARLRIPGGQLTSGQWAALADCAASLGDGGLQLTSRGNLEIRGLAAGAENELAAVSASHGLLPSIRHERVRSIVSSPLSGLDGRGSVDVSALVPTLDAAIQAAPALAELSGRFLFGLDDGRGDVAGLGADLTVFGSQLLIDGHTCAISVDPADSAELLVAAATAFLAEADGSWRIADLPHGVDLVAARLGGRRGPRPPVGSPPPLGFVGAQDGTVALITSAPFGRFTARQAGLIAAMGTPLRLTPWRSVVLPGLTAARAARTARELRAAGLAVDNSSPWRTVTACAGRPGCHRALADVRADARAAVESRAPAMQGLPVHWSGCERRCGHPRAEFLDMLATPTGYRTGTR